MTTAKTINSTFLLYLAANTDKTIIQVDYGDGIKVDETIGTTSTKISGKLGDSQTIKIYGKGINILDCSNYKLTTLDVTNAIALTELYCYKNDLTALDVTQNTLLKYLFCQSNQLTALDITHNSALVRLDCSNNLLKTIDISKNTALTRLYCYLNPITALDISQNAALNWLDCSNHNLKTLDVSKNIALTLLYCSSNQLKTLDVSKNAALSDLYCSSNQLSELDITHNTGLTWLDCSNNKLKTLDVTKNAMLYALSCKSNQFNFATLPLNKSSWATYSYAPQLPIPIMEDISTGNELDLSSQYYINRNLTNYIWKTKRGSILNAGTDYTLVRGKTIFLKPQVDSVYCEMTNATFPYLTGINVLTTTYTKVSLASAIINTEKQKVELYTYNKILYINLPYNAQLFIFDVNGSQVLSNFLNSGLHNIQLQNSGVYMVKIANKNEMIIKKIISE
jgi:hypothetical protein